MGFLKLYPTKDAFISSKLYNNNYGADEVMQLSITSTMSAVQDVSRTLMQFSLSDQALNVTTGAFTAVLTLYNCPNSDFTDENFTVEIYPLTETWDEGRHSVMFPASGPVSYMRRTQNNLWTTSGGSYSGSPSASFTFSAGTENLTANFSAFVNHWRNTGNSGFLIKLANESQTGLSGGYSNMKTFFGTNTHTFFRPHLTILYPTTPITDDIANLRIGTNKLYVYDRNASGTAYPGAVVLKDNLTLSSSTAQTLSYVAPFTWSFTTNINSLRWDPGIWMVQSNTATNASTTSSFTGTALMTQTNLWTSKTEANVLTNEVYFQEESPVLRATITTFIHRGMGSLGIKTYPTAVYLRLYEKNTWTQAMPEEEMSYDKDGYFTQVALNNFLSGFHYVPVLRIVESTGNIVYKELRHSAFYVKKS